MFIQPPVLRSRSWLGVIAITMLLAALFLVLPAYAAAQAEDGERGQPVEVTASGLHLFQANLSSSEESPAPSTLATGRTLLALDADTHMLYYRISVRDIMSITGAHIHTSADGAIVKPLFPTPASEPFDPAHPLSGQVSLTEEQQTALMNGEYYVNVHTSANPGGEIRGDIEPLSVPSDLSALLLGRNEAPDPVESDASGVARFSFVSTDTLQYQVTVQQIMSVTAAHIHRGAPGESGPPIVTLYDGTGSFDPANPITGTVTLTATQMLDLLAGYLYVNVHTEQNPAGEIRGQIEGAQLFEARLSGANEVPAVSTAATGRAVLALDAGADTLHYRIHVRDIMSVTAAHIHLGAPGENGGVVFPLFTGSGTFGPDHPISGTLTLSDTQVADLISGNYYVNIHTEQNPAGEIRGQIEAFEPPARFYANLSTANEVPPVMGSNATGLGRLVLDPVTNMLHYDIEVEQIGTITGAHIHRGERGENGGVLFTLFSSGQGSFGPDDPIGGAVQLDAQNLVDLLTEYLYVNVHTEANPGGEIRAQITAEHKIYLPLTARPQESAPIE